MQSVQTMSNSMCTIHEPLPRTNTMVGIHPWTVIAKLKVFDDCRLAFNTGQITLIA